MGVRMRAADDCEVLEDGGAAAAAGPGPREKDELGGEKMFGEERKGEELGGDSR